jgi:cysteine/O-acetylserine efflux protein
LFSAFLAPITDNVVILILTAILLAITAFCATSTWAMFGTAIKTYLHQSRVKAFVNIILSLFLVYTAVELAGVL